MKRTNKKAFTIVELVIVIAIIAILAAVIIAIFAGIRDKAIVSKDMQLIRNLNTALKADVEHKHNTMTDALEAAANFGYDVTKINTSRTDAEILWDSKNDAFCYFDGGEIKYNAGVKKVVENPANVDYWIIADEEDDMAKGYSIYCTPEVVAYIPATLNVGFDAGKCEGITAVNYSNSGEGQSVVIRTNNKETTLTIDSSTDTVKHYDVCGAVNIIESAMHSYEEYGAVSFLEVAKGRVALQAGAEVEQLHFNAKTVAEFDEIKIAADPSVTLPVFSRDDVTIGSAGVLVVELQKDTNDNEQTDKDYIWLYQQGLVQQIRISESATEISDVKATDAGVDAKTAKAADEIANNLRPGASYTATQIDEGSVAEADVEKTGLTAEEKTEIKQEIKDAAEAERVAEEKKEDVNAVAWNKTSNIYYNNLYEAFASVSASGEKTTIVLLKDVLGNSNKNYEILAGQNVVFDLNGHTLNTVAADDKTAYTILNKGTLTIKDSTDKKKDGTGTGKMEINALNPDLKGIPSYASNVITNNSIFVLESGFIDNGSMGSAAFGIDNSIGSTTTINGGKITTSMAQAIRVMVGSTAETTFAFHGGYIKSLWIQNYAQGDTSAKLNMLLDGGEVNIVSAEVKCSPSGSHWDISGADFHMHFDKNIKVKDKIELASYDETGYADADILISGGTFEGTILDTYSSYGDVGKTKYVITGGTFKNEKNWSDTQYVYSKESGLGGMVGSFASAFSKYGVTDVNDSIIDEMMSDSHKEEYIFNETVKFAHFQTATGMLGKPCYRVYLLVDSFNASRVASGYHAVDNNDGTITVVKDAD